MVTTAADPSSNHHSPTSAAATTNSPKFPRKNLPSPWAQVVRGADSEPLHQSPPSSSSSFSSFSSSLDSVNSDAATVDNSNADKKNNAGTPKKPAWKSPSNGVAEVGPVMGAVSWPALSESAKPSAKLTSDSSSADGSLSTPQEPVTSHFPQKHATGNAKPTPAMNYGVPNRQRSIKRGGGGNGHSIGPGPVQNSFSNPYPNLPPSPPPPFPVLQIPPPSTFANGVPGPSPRDPYRNNTWDTRSPVGGFHSPTNEHRSPSGRGSFWHHPRRDGQHQNNYGSRRDPDRRNYANNIHQQRMPPRGFMRPPPPNPASFMGPQPLRPFVNPGGGFPEFYYFPTLQLEPHGAMPFLTQPPPAMYFSVAETPLTNTILKQIDYYFSDANLVKDAFLRSNMDEQGWVPITLIASFPRVRSLTSNIELILDSLRTSSVVEVQGDKLRRRNEWMRWLPSAQRRADSGSVSLCGSSCNNIAADFEKITLNEATTDKVNSNSTTNGDAPRESSSQSQLPNGDSTGTSN